MKKAIQLSLVFALLSATSFIYPVQAQDATKELTAFTKKFEDACNKQDVKTMRELFTKDAVRVNTDGQTENGIDAIVAAYEELFQMKMSVILKQDKVTTENGSTISTGTYQAKGTSSSGESFDVGGGFTHTMVKDNGQWKISKQVLTSL